MFNHNLHYNNKSVINEQSYCPDCKIMCQKGTEGACGGGGGGVLTNPWISTVHVLTNRVKSV